MHRIKVSVIMKTEYVVIDENNSEGGYKRAGEIIKAGGLVAFPTETVYGLGGDALNADASKKIYAAKGRPSDNPLIVHIADIEDLDGIVSYIPDAARILAEKFWPGPLTMVFKKSETVPESTTGGLDTVAVRMPDHPIALRFIKASGGYIAAPSANISGRPSPTTGKHVLDDMDGRIEMILDGGPCGIGLESTIVDVTEEIPMILRPGYISIQMVRDVLGRAEYDPAITQGVKSDVRPKAPGMKYRHYAPQGDLVIVSGERVKVANYIKNALIEAKNKGKVTGVIASTETAGAYKADVLIEAGSLTDEDEIARRLYSALREFDEKGAEVIFSEEFNVGQVGSAIMNRLMKAAGHRVIEV